MSKLLSDKDKSNYVALIRPFLELVFTKVEYSVALVEMQSLLKTIVNNEYTIKEDSTIALQYSINPEHKLTMLQESYINDISILIKDADMYVETTDLYPAYILVMKDEIERYLTDLQNKNDTDRNDYLNNLRIRHDESTQSYKNNTDKLALPIATNLESVDVNLITEHGLDPKTKPEELACCVAIIKIKSYIVDLLQKVENENESESESDDSFEELHEVVLQKFHVEFDAVQTALVSLCVENLSVPCVRDVKVFGSVHVFFEWMNDLFDILNDLQNLFNGSIYTTKEFLLLPDHERKYLAYNSKELINMIHLPDNTNVFKIYLPCMAAVYRVRSNITRVPSSSEYDANNNEDDKYKDNLFKIPQLLKDNDLLEMNNMQIDFGRISVVIYNIEAVFKGGLICIDEVKACSQEIKNMLLFNADTSTKLLQLVRKYGLQISSVQRMSIDRVKFLMFNLDIIKDLDYYKLLDMKYIADILSDTELELLFNNNDKIIDLYKRTGASVENLFKLGVEKLNFGLKNLDKLETLMHFYFITLDEMHGMDQFEFERMFSNPAFCMQHSYNNVPFNLERLTGVLAANIYTGLEFAKQVANKGWLLNVKKISRIPRESVVELRSCGLDFRQVREIVSIMIKIHQLYANQLTKKYMPKTHIRITEDLLNYNFLGQLFDPASATIITDMLNKYFASLVNMIEMSLPYDDVESILIEQANEEFDNDTDITLRTSEILPCLKTLVTRLCDAEGDVNVKHIVLFNKLINSRLSQGYKDSGVEKWKSIANNWVNMLKDNYSAEDLQVEIFPIDYDDYQDTVISEFYSFYVLMKSFKTVVSQYKFLPDDYMSEDEFQLFNENLSAVRNMTSCRSS